MPNVECDVTVALLLSKMASEPGRVYTICRGDEPAECKALVDYARDIGFTVVCARKDIAGSPTGPPRPGCSRPFRKS